MDPFTVLAGATAIYNGLKSAVSAGEDVVDTAHRVGSLMSEVAKVVQLVSMPRKKSVFQSQAEFEAEAMKLYAAKDKANQMAAEAKNMFVSLHGLAAWDNVQRKVIELRKEAARHAKEEYEQAMETRRDIIMVSSIVGGLLVVMGGLGIWLSLTH
jgi:hypothetical protein